MPLVRKLLFLLKMIIFFYILAEQIKATKLGFSGREKPTRRAEQPTRLSLFKTNAAFFFFHYSEAAKELALALESVLVSNACFGAVTRGPGSLQSDGLIFGC